MKTKIFKAYESISGKFVVFGSDGLREYPADRCQNITDAKLLYIHDAIKNNQLFTIDEYKLIEKSINGVIDMLVLERERAESADRTERIADIMTMCQSIKSKIKDQMGCKNDL